MAAACEALRLIDKDGLNAEDRERLGVRGEDGAEANEMGRLYRIAMMKDRVWNGVPIEYAKIQTDSPAKGGWNSGWTR